MTTLRDVNLSPRPCASSAIASTLMLEAALQYAGRGWPVFRLSRGKLPLKGSHGFKDATTDSRQIEAWWRETPWANLGLATGQQVIIDCDGAGGIERFLDLARANGGLPVTSVAATPSGGRHYYFRPPKGAAIKTSHEKRRTAPAYSADASTAHDGLDVKGLNGYVLLPPSSVPTASGQRAYQWLHEAPLAEMPGWLVEWCLARGQGTIAARPSKKQPLASALLGSGRRRPEWLAGAASYGVADRAITASFISELPDFLKALREINAECSYDRWFEVGAAIHDFCPGPDGLAIFQAWSMTSVVHQTDKDQQACARKWATEYGKDREGRPRITRASVYAWAKEARQEKERAAVIQAPPFAQINGHAPTNAPLSFIDLDKNGNRKGTTANAAVAIQNLGITCRKDVFHEKLLVGGHPIAQWAGDLSDEVVTIIRGIIKRCFDFDAGSNNTRDAAIQLCLEHQFNPVLDYLDGLQWDGMKRIETWAIGYLGAKDTPLNREIGRLMLVAAVRRARQPGCKFDQIIVMEGKEGTGKSTAIRILAGDENFSDQSILGHSEREQQEACAGVWLYEIAELAGMRRTDVERIKAFASRTEDRARPAYGRFRQDIKRKGIFVATTNEDTYLKGETGNRRFWPLETGWVQLEALKRDRDQIWAEASELESSGISLEMDRKLWKAAAEQQESRIEDDAWMQIVDDWLAKHGCEDTTVTDVLMNVFTLSYRDITRSDQMRIASVLRRLGFVRYRKSIGDRREWRYRWAG